MDCSFPAYTPEIGKNKQNKKQKGVSRIEQFRAEKYNRLFNWRALAVWAGTLVACFFMPFHLFFRWLPGYFIALTAYILLQLIRKK